MNNVIRYLAAAAALFVGSIASAQERARPDQALRLVFESRSDEVAMAVAVVLGPSKSDGRDHTWVVRWNQITGRFDVYYVIRDQPVAHWSVDAKARNVNLVCHAKVGADACG